RADEDAAVAALADLEVAGQHEVAVALLRVGDVVARLEGVDAAVFDVGGLEVHPAFRGLPVEEQRPAVLLLLLAQLIVAGRRQQQQRDHHAHGNPSSSPTLPEGAGWERERYFRSVLATSRRCVACLRKRMAK